MSRLHNGNYAVARNRESITMANVATITMTRGLRGKGNKGEKVEFQGIDDAVARPDNPMESALQLVNGDMQGFWERFVLGFNEYSYEAVADPIAAFINSAWDADKTKQFRAAVNALSKVTGKDREDVAEELAKTLG